MPTILIRLLKCFHPFSQLIFKYIRKGFIVYYSTKAKIVCAGYTNPLNVNHKSSLTKNTFLGKNTNFNGMKIQGCGKVTIGDNFHSGTECMMITQNHNYNSDHSIPYDRHNILKEIVIEDNVWIGNRVLILGGVTIGEGAIVQAGSVVVSDVSPCSIVGGNPAKHFKYRDKEKYFRLKEQNRFF